MFPIANNIYDWLNNPMPFNSKWKILEIINLKTKKL